MNFLDVRQNSSDTRQITPSEKKAKPLRVSRSLTLKASVSPSTRRSRYPNIKAYLEGVGGLGVQGANRGVQILPVRRAHRGLVEGATEGVERDVDGTTVSARFLDPFPTCNSHKTPRIMARSITDGTRLDTLATDISVSMTATRTLNPGRATRKQPLERRNESVKR